MLPSPRSPAARSSPFGLGSAVCEALQAERMGEGQRGCSRQGPVTIAEVRGTVSLVSLGNHHRVDRLSGVPDSQERVECLSC